MVGAMKQNFQLRSVLFCSIMLAWSVTQLKGRSRNWFNCFISPKMSPTYLDETYFQVWTLALEQNSILWLGRERGEKPYFFPNLHNFALLSVQILFFYETKGDKTRKTSLQLESKMVSVIVSRNTVNPRTGSVTFQWVWDLTYHNQLLEEAIITKLGKEAHSFKICVKSELKMHKHINTFIEAEAHCAVCILPFRPLASAKQKIKSSNWWYMELWSLLTEALGSDTCPISIEVQKMTWLNCTPVLN